ncbi:Neuronal acetylcholine receptor subunit alpha-9 [Holothuria leucospilota]|uniref:Neuronal acetylcholine receptor subunit alpha-9 n=1 Tax=Holothuria leucospilota TaxID=206669 RepID=A0A9Q1BTT9_HOLLE|nr:Neuronal acetylcholine receptor subunit alpha-9 [Holothuria leucospilota]
MVTPNAERRVMEYIFHSNNYSTDERPVLNASESVEVVTSLFMIAILDLVSKEEARNQPNVSHFIKPLSLKQGSGRLDWMQLRGPDEYNEKQQVLRTASWVTFSWFDPRLKWNPDDFEGVDLINVKLDDVWLPRLYLNNGVEIDAVIESSRGMILLTADGEINLGTPLIQSTHCPIRIKYFPFDTQVCQLRINTRNIPVEKLSLNVGASVLGADVSSSEWEAIELNATSETFQDSGIVANRQYVTYPRLRFCLFLRRYSSYYVSLLIIPSIVLNVMASMTFLSPPDSGERISLSVSMILGLSVFQLLVADILPVTREDTPIISTYLTGNFLLAIFSIPFSLVTVNIVYDPTTFFRICNKFQSFFGGFLGHIFLSKSQKETNTPKIDKSSIQVIYDDEILKEKVTTATEATNEQENEVETTLPQERNNKTDRKFRCTKVR